MAGSTKNFANLLKKAGLRITSPRIAILSILDEFPHLDTEDVKTIVTERLGTVSTQAVYDSLNVLTANGILRRVEPRGVRAVYEIDYGDNHHHFVCHDCNLLLNVPCAKGERPCIDPGLGSEYIVDEAEVIYWGYCDKCASSRNQETGE